MFHVVGVDGIQRAFTPGSFRPRLEVQPIHKTESIVETTHNPTSSDGNTKRSQFLARYDAQTQSNEHSEVLYAHEIMTSPVHSMPATTTIHEVTKVFTGHRYRHIPLVSPEANLVGLISDRDVLRYRASASPRDGHGDNEKVSKIMVTQVLIATPDTPIRDIARTMVEERIGSLPILDLRDTLVGIITRSDILRALITHGPMRLWA